MGICRQMRVYSSHHEWVGNLFSLLAVVLIFGTVWGSLQYYQQLEAWIHQNVVLNTAILVAALVTDVLLILAFLAIGSSRAEEEDESCFATFKGRRSGGSPISAFRSWLHHMENVGKKHR